MPYLDMDFLLCIRHRSLQGYCFLPPDTAWRLVWIWRVILDDEGEGFILFDFFHEFDEAFNSFDYGHL